MKTFQDAAGRTWTVAVNVDAIKRVRALLQEDLLDIEHVFPRLLVDPILLCDVIYCVCKPQADAEQITDVDFARTMAGDTIAHAKQALIEEIVSFFPEQNQRKTLMLMIKNYDVLANEVTKLVQRKLETFRLPKEIEAALKSVGDSFTNSQESSE